MILSLESRRPLLRALLITALSIGITAASFSALWGASHGETASVPCADTEIASGG
jgi:hypothetical protein